MFENKFEDQIYKWDTEYSMRIVEYGKTANGIHGPTPTALKMCLIDSVVTLAA